MEKLQSFEQLEIVPSSKQRFVWMISYFVKDGAQAGGDKNFSFTQDEASTGSARQ